MLLVTAQPMQQKHCSLGSKEVSPSVSSSPAHSLERSKLPTRCIPATAKLLFSLPSRGDNHHSFTVLHEHPAFYQVNCRVVVKGHFALPPREATRISNSRETNNGVQLPSISAMHRAEKVSGEDNTFLADGCAFCNARKQKSVMGVVDV